MGVQAVARVMSPAGESVGGAFLVAPGTLLTAAHVVNLAAGRDGLATDRPTGHVLLSFAAQRQRLVRAEVTHWVPPGDASPEDIAGLQLLESGPDGIVPAPLTDLREPLGRSVMTFGFPRDAPHGGWGHGRLAGSDIRDLVQVDTLPDSQFTIERGFSGTPVWDVEDEAVAGLVVEGWTRGRRSGFMIPTSELLAAWPRLAERVRPASPFRGLRSFREYDSDMFFGREELIDQIVTLTGHASALTVFGPSGVGKSSLLHAGVVPRLRQREGLVVATMRPSAGRTPLRAVAMALAQAAQPRADLLSPGRKVDEIADRLTRGLVTEVIGDVLAKHHAERLLLVVDQLEEVLITPPGDLKQFADVLSSSQSPGSRLDLLIALRGDFFTQVLRHGALAELVQDNSRLVPVGELGPSALRRAIEEPVRRTRMVRYEAGLVDRILDDVGLAAGRLPLLQFTLAMLWDDQDSSVLTHRAYDAMDGVESALATHAEAVWDGLSATDRAAAGRLLVQLLYPVGEKAGFVRRAAPRDQLDSGQWAAAQRLANDRARLVVLRDQDSKQVVELAHDALVTHWPELTKLGERDREFRQWQEGVRQRISRAAPPLTGADLREALKWQASRGTDLAPAEHAYLTASRRRRTTRRRVWTAAVVVVALVGTLVVVSQEKRVANDAADNILHRAQLADPYDTLRMSLRAYRTSPTLSTSGRLAAEYNAYAQADSVIPDYTARSILVPNRDPQAVEPPSALASKISADGRTLVTTDPRNNITLWRINGSTVTEHALGASATRVTISRDGRYVAYLQDSPDITLKGSLGSCDGVCLYDTATGRTRRLGSVNAVFLAPVIRFDPAGHVLVMAYSPDSVHQRLVSWDVATGKQLDDVAVPGGELDVVHDMWLAPGGRQVLLDVERPVFPGSRELDDILASVDLSGPKPTAVAQTDAIDGRQVAVSADGTRLAVLLPVNPVTGHLDPHPRSRLAIMKIAPVGIVEESQPLTEEQSLGELALDQHGDNAYVTSEETVYRWQTSDLDARPVTEHLAVSWEDVLPLGGDNGPLLLVRTDAVGLVLPKAGDQPPFKRITTPAPDLDENTDEAYDRLVAMLASGVPVADEVTNLPAGSYTGTIGG
jgi:Trypsin-like peptidase domain